VKQKKTRHEPSTKVEDNRTTNSIQLKPMSFEGVVSIAIFSVPYQLLILHT